VIAARSRCSRDILVAMQPGDLVGGRFEIHDRVASGGMGTVFRARDRETARTVAVKVIADSRPGDLERFSR